MRVDKISDSSAATLDGYFSFKSMAFVLVIFVAACGASERPLSIKMHNPKTNVTLNCAARDTGSQNNEVLANVVETCARQLESKGFIRAGGAP